MSTVWRVDAHQHFWRFDPASYGWIGDDMAVLKRDFLPAELRFELDIRHIGGSVAVQAGLRRRRRTSFSGWRRRIRGFWGSWAGSICGPAIWNPGLRRGLRPSCSRDTAIRCRMSRLLRRFWRWAVQPWRGNAPAGGQGLRGPDPRERSARRHCLLRAARFGAARAGSPRASRMSGMRARRSGPGASPRSRRRSM